MEMKGVESEERVTKRESLIFDTEGVTNRGIKFRKKRS